MWLGERICSTDNFQVRGIMFGKIKIKSYICPVFFERLSGSDGGIGRHAGLKILWAVMPVPVRPRFRVPKRSFEASLFFVCGVQEVCFADNTMGICGFHKQACIPYIPIAGYAHSCTATPNCCAHLKAVARTKLCLLLDLSLRLLVFALVLRTSTPVPSTQEKL